jgi:hypothetical protein
MLTDSKIKFKASNLYFYFTIFLVTFIIFRVILPYGDEPDYIYKYQLYIFNIEGLNYINTTDYSQSITCNSRNIIGTIFEPIMRIKPFFCNNSVTDILERVSIGFVLNILYFTIIFILFKNKKKLKYLKIEKGLTDINMHIFFCSLIYPSVIYHLGMRSNEVFLFYLILLFFLIWNSYLLSYLLGFLTILIDVGNGLVFFMFINYFYLFRYLVSFIKLKKILYFHFALFFILILFHEPLRLAFASFLDSINTTYLFPDFNQYKNSISKYVLRDDRLYETANIFKLFIAYASFIFFTPAYLKSTILFILMSCLFFYIFLIMMGFVSNKKYKFVTENKFYNEYITNVIICIFFTLLIILVVPTFAFIRYYLFIYPFIFSLFYLIFNQRITFLISIYAICLVSTELILFRMFFYLLPDINVDSSFATE